MERLIFVDTQYIYIYKFLETGFLIYIEYMMVIRVRWQKYIIPIVAKIVDGQIEKSIQRDADNRLEQS